MTNRDELDERVAIKIDSGIPEDKAREQALEEQRQAAKEKRKR